MRGSEPADRSTAGGEGKREELRYGERLLPLLPCTGEV